MSKQIEEVMGLVKGYTKEALQFYGWENGGTHESMNSSWSAIEAKLRELLPVWQPIESAPDEEWLMVWVSVDECASIAQKSDGLWFDEYGLMQDGPSFYMPLPKAPE